LIRDMLQRERDKGTRSELRDGTQPEGRLLKVVAFLLAHHPDVVSRDEIWEAFPNDYAGSFAAREKKWTRDKNLLEAAGIHIQYVQDDPESPQGYCLNPRECGLPPIDFKPEEMAVLRAAGSAATRLAGQPWQDLESALRKLRWYGAEAGRAAPRPAISYPARQVGEHEARFVEVIKEAVTRRKRVRLKYFTAKRQDEATRDVDVYGFAWRRGVWLFAGYCHLRKALRIFYVSRVREIAILNDKSDGPTTPCPRTSTRARSPTSTLGVLGARAGRGGLLFRSRPELEPTPALVAQQIPRAQVESRPEGVLARVKASNADALVRHVFATGLDVEVLAPPKVRATARKLLECVVQGGEP
jgi:proteasome accessory factor B